MKLLFTILFVMSAAGLWAQDTSAITPSHTLYERHSVIATVSVGFIDQYRHDYSLPIAFEKSNVSGFAPFYARLEYGLSNQLGIAAAFGYDAFTYNFNQLYTGYNGPIKRYKTDNFRMISAGAIFYYHLGNLIPIKHLDPFIGAGVSLNNIRHSALPQDDSTVAKVEHTVTPYLKAGVRYYLSDKFSLYADAGFDHESVFSIGASCRFFSKTKMQR